jgi:hypothetical protein
VTRVLSCDLQVYELRDSSWFDRGTGQCKGVYDDRLDVALLVVEAEETPKSEGEGGEGDQDEPGGFLQDGEGEAQLLLRSRVEKADTYSKQQGQSLVDPSLMLTAQIHSLSGRKPVASTLPSHSRMLMDVRIFGLSSPKSSGTSTTCQVSRIRTLNND